MKCCRIVFLFIVCFCFAPGLMAEIKSISNHSVYIDNLNPRRDTTGEIMDIHDGNILYSEGTYYYYGTAYGNCIEIAGPDGCANVSKGSCGFQTDHKVALFTSKDLVNWEHHAPVFEIAKEFAVPAVLYSPKVIYNKKSAQYVLWYNWLDATDGTPLFSKTYYGIAVSSSPFGPFKVVNPQVAMKNPDTGDLHLLVDDDSNHTAYVIYTAYIHGDPSHRMSIERLAPDYLSSTGEGSGFFGDTFVEAPAFFKRNGTYYALFGQCSCFGAAGSATAVYTARFPLGPYTRQTAEITAAISAQQTDVMSVETANGLTYLWRGDRWQSTPDKIKGHDFSYFAPLVFSENGMIAPLKWENGFNLELPAKSFYAIHSS